MKFSQKKGKSVQSDFSHKKEGVGTIGGGLFLKRKVLLILILIFLSVIFLSVWCVCVCFVYLHHFHQYHLRFKGRTYSY